MNGVVAAVSAVVAVVSLFSTVASLLAALAGGIVLAPFAFGLFLLAVTGVFSGVEDGAVREQNPVLDGRRWRTSS